MTDIVLPQNSQEVGSPLIVGVELEAQTLKRVDNDSKTGFQDSPEGIAEMQDHYLDMINPERLRTTAPLEEGYKQAAIKQANQFLIEEGFKIRGQDSRPSLFQ